MFACPHANGHASSDLTSVHSGHARLLNRSCIHYRVTRYHRPRVRVVPLVVTMHCMDRHHHWTPPRPTSHYDKPIAQGHRPPTTNHCQVRTCHPTTSHCQVLSIGWASLFTTRPATSGAPSSSECEMPTHHPSCEATHQPSCEATHQPSCEMATHHLLWSLIPYMATHHLLWSLIPCAPPRTWPATHHPAAAPMAIPREDYESQRARPGHCVAAERFLAQYDMLADPPLKLGERSYIPADPPLKLGERSYIPADPPADQYRRSS